MQVTQAQIAEAEAAISEYNAQIVWGDPEENHVRLADALSEILTAIKRHEFYQAADEDRCTCGLPVEAPVHARQVVS